MPEKKTLKKARKAKREGKAPSTQAGGLEEEQIGNTRRAELLHRVEAELPRSFLR